MGPIRPRPTAKPRPAACNHRSAPPGARCAPGRHRRVRSGAARRRTPPWSPRWREAAGSGTAVDQVAADHDHVRHRAAATSSSSRWRSVESPGCGGPVRRCAAAGRGASILTSSRKSSKARSRRRRRSPAGPRRQHRQAPVAASCDSLGRPDAVDPHQVGQRALAHRVPHQDDDLVAGLDEPGGEQLALDHGDDVLEASTWNSATNGRTSRRAGAGAPPGRRG